MATLPRENTRTHTKGDTAQPSQKYSKHPGEMNVFSACSVPVSFILKMSNHFSIFRYVYTHYFSAMDNAAMSLLAVFTKCVFRINYNTGCQLLHYHLKLCLLFCCSMISVWPTAVSSACLLHLCERNQCMSITSEKLSTQWTGGYISLLELHQSLNPKHILEL